MKNVGTCLARYSRLLAIGLGAIGLIGVSYVVAAARYKAARELVDAAKGHISRSDWPSAVQCLDRALRQDRFLPADVHLLRATAINRYIEQNLATHARPPAGYTREDALNEVDLYLGDRPGSGQAYFERACALAGLAKVEAARDAFGQAIPLLADPTEALVARAGLSFHVGDYAAAEKEISAAIERHPLVAEYYEERALYRKFTRDARGASLDEARAARLRERPEPVTLEDLQALERDRHDRPITAAQDSPPVVAERARFAGTWTVVATETEGVVTDRTESIYLYRFHDDRYSASLDGQTQPEASFRLDPSRQPAEIDLIRTIDGRTVTLLGIYTLGDRLSLCIANEGEPRPAEFTTKGVERVVLLTLRPPCDKDK